MHAEGFFAMRLLGFLMEEIFAQERRAEQGTEDSLCNLTKIELPQIKKT